MTNKAAISILMLSTSFLLGTTAVYSKSIKDLVPNAQLTEFCQANGLGEFAVQLTLPDESTVSGTIHCESENMSASGDDSPNDSVDDVDDDGPDHDLNDDDDDDDHSSSGGSDDHGDDDHEDDHSNSGSSHEDDGHDSGDDD